MSEFSEYIKAGNLAAANAQKNGTHAVDKLEQIYADAYAAACAKKNNAKLELTAIGGTGMRKRKILKTRKTRRKCKH
jgi:hypothetical protein